MSDDEPKRKAVRSSVLKHISSEDSDEDEVPRLLRSLDKPTSLVTERVPPSEALLRARAFLPQLKAENKILEAKLASGAAKEEFDIEHVDEEEPHIEMDIFCGLLGKKGAKEGEIRMPGDAEENSDEDDESEDSRPQIDELN